MVANVTHVVDTSVGDSQLDALARFTAPKDRVAGVVVAKSANAREATFAQNVSCTRPAHSFDISELSNSRITAPAVMMAQVCPTFIGAFFVSMRVGIVAVVVVILCVVQPVLISSLEFGCLCFVVVPTFAMVRFMADECAKYRRSRDRS